MKLFAYLKASGTFAAELFRRRDSVRERGPGGYPLLDGWERSPERAVVEAIERRRNAVRPPARAALCCYEGPHRGQVLLVRGELETLGAESHHDIVVTPGPRAAEGAFQLTAKRGLRLLAGPGGGFRLNGTDARESELYDYDRIELLGNRFVVLDLAGGMT